MKKFFMLFWLVALLFLGSYFSLVSASPPGPYQPAIEEYNKAKAAAEKEKKLKESNVGKAKPSEVRGTVPKARTEPGPLTGPKQMYKWKDEKGQWHFSDAPPPGVKAQLVGGIDKREASKVAALGRSYVGIALGQKFESFFPAKKTVERGRDARGLRIFAVGRGQWPSGAEDLAAGFLQDTLVSIEVKFGASHLETIGGWDGLLRETGLTYGAPVKADIQKALWRDGETGLLLVRGGNGAVTARFGELRSAFAPQDLE